jgi:hypothetical protein
VLVILIIAGIVYLATATAAGTWIAENIVAPIFNAFDKSDETTDNNDGGIDIVNASAKPSGTATPASSNTDSAEVKVQSITFYALQMGVFSTQANAETAAAELIRRGGAGYIMQDGDKYRVFAAVYASEADLAAVRTKLKDEGYDSTSHLIEKDGITFKVTASASKISAIQAGFDGLHDACTKFGEIVLAFDKDSLEVSAGQEKVKTLQTEFTQTSDTITKEVGETQNDVILSVKAQYETVSAALKALAEGSYSDKTAFSAKLKYAYIDMIVGYKTLLEKIG